MQREQSHQPYGDFAVLIGDEGAGVLDQIGDDLADAQVVALDDETRLHARLALDGEFDLHFLLAAADLPRNLDKITAQWWRAT